MKKILNWTFGGLFRTLGRILCYVALGLLAALLIQKNDIKITDLLGITTVHAAETTVPISSSKYKIRTENRTTGAITTSSFINAGTNTTINETTHRLTNLYGYIYLGSNTLTTGKTYTILVNWTLSPANQEWNDYIFIKFKNYIKFNFYGNSSSTESGGSEEYIQSYSVRIEPACSECSRVRFYFTIVPAMDMKFFGFQIDLNPIYNLDGDYLFNSGWNYINFPAGSSYQNIKYNTDDTANAVNNQTIIIQNEFDNVNNNINNVNDNLEDIAEIGHGIAEGIHDNDTSESSDEASDFFSNFSTNTHGLTSIITAPLTAIQSITSATCTPLHIPIPFLTNKYIDLPCMRAIYDDNFGSFMTLWDTISLGIVSYWIMVRIFSLVKDFKNPEHDEIEVVDL